MLIRLLITVVPLALLLEGGYLLTHRGHPLVGGRPPLPARLTSGWGVTSVLCGGVTAGACLLAPLPLLLAIAGGAILVNLVMIVVLFWHLVDGE